MNNVEFLRGLPNIIIPSDFTYFNHCTGYIPDSVKEMMVNGKYIRVWGSIPLDSFTVNGEMSFVERKGRIDSCLDYRKPLSEASIIYVLPDYCKPFMIRAIMPRRAVIQDRSKSEEYRNDLRRIYSGLGDGRHEKLPHKTNLLVIGSSQEDEISGKKVDIIYCVRDIDLDWYTEEVKEAIKNSTLEEFSVPSDLSRNSDFSFLLRGVMLPKDKDFSRFEKIDGLSDFDMDYYDDYKELIDSHTVDGKLVSLSTEERGRLHNKFESEYLSGNGFYLR
jgi:hypothetical protein